MSASWRSEWRSDSHALNSAGTKVAGGIPRRPCPDKHGRFTLGSHGASGSQREPCNRTRDNSASSSATGLTSTTRAFCLSASRTSCNSFSACSISSWQSRIIFSASRILADSGNSLSRAFDECHRICNALVDWRDRGLTLGAHQCSFQTCLLFDVVDCEVRNGCLDPCDFGRGHRAHFCTSSETPSWAAPKWVAAPNCAPDVGGHSDGGFGPRTTWATHLGLPTLVRPLRPITRRSERQKKQQQIEHSAKRQTAREQRLPRARNVLSQTVEWNMSVLLIQQVERCTYCTSLSVHHASQWLQLQVFISREPTSWVKIRTDTILTKVYLFER